MRQKLVRSLASIRKGTLLDSKVLGPGKENGPMAPTIDPSGRSSLCDLVEGSRDDSSTNIRKEPPSVRILYSDCPPVKTGGKDRRPYTHWVCRKAVAQ